MRFGNPVPQPNLRPKYLMGPPLLGGGVLLLQDTLTHVVSVFQDLGAFEVPYSDFKSNAHCPGFE